MNLEFESLVENLEKNMSKNIDKESEINELEVALNEANDVVKTALENDKAVLISPVVQENKKEVVIKNAQDEKVATLEINESKNEDVKNEILLTKTENNNKSVAENNKLKEIGIDVEKGTNKLQKFFETTERLGVLGKVLAAIGKIGGTLVDSIAKKYLKDKFKINYSTYNNGKKTVTAAIKKDGEAFIKKGFDTLLSAFKKIPASTKMVIRNVKNKVVEEAFKIGKFLIAK